MYCGGEIISKRYNLVGQTFGKLTVKEKTMNPNSKSKKIYWLCECSCGGQSIVSTTDLVSGKITQCRECGIKQSGKSKTDKWIGKKFGMLTVIDVYTKRHDNGRVRTICICECECGNIVEKKVDHLKRSKDDPLYSCGCTDWIRSDLRAKDVIGEKFGRLTVVEEFKENKIRKLKCKCDCGNEITVTKRDAVNQINDLSSSSSEVANAVDNLNSLVNDLSTKTAYIVMTTDETGSPCIELGKSDNDFKVRITNTSVDFMDGTSKIAYVSNQALYIEKAIIKDEIQIGEGSGFVLKRRSNGNMGIRWVGGS